MANQLLFRILIISSFLFGIKSTSANPALDKNVQKSALLFMENIGQVTDQYSNTREDIDFRLKAGNGLNIFIGAGQIHYQWAKSNTSKKAKTFKIEQQNEEPDLVDPFQMYRMDVQLIGADPNAKIIKEEKQNFFERYYLPSVKNEGGKSYSYKRITYKNVYDHIDWVFYFNENGLMEHDFIVNPGGKVSDIKIQYTGASNLELTKNGQLSIVCII